MRLGNSDYTTATAEALNLDPDWSEGADQLSIPSALKEGLY